MDLLEKYLNYLQYQRKYSSHTLSSYKTDITQFLKYIKGNFSEIDINNVSHLIIRSWMVELVESNITAKTINRKVSSLRSFFNYLKKIGEVTKNPTLKIITPKIPKRLPSYIQEDNLEKLFDTLNVHDFEELRNRLIIELFYTTGIRRSELINLKDKNLDRSNQAIKVLGKGNKERLIPLSAQIIDKIENYQKKRDEEFEDVDTFEALFVTNKGRKFYPKGIYNLVKRYLSTVTSIAKRSPHVLRHSFATHLMNGGADLNAVKELLGHANLAATQVYTHNSIEKLKKTYKNAHPRSEK